MWFSTHKTCYFKLGIVGGDIHPRRICIWTTKKSDRNYMISNGCICTNMLLPKCSQVPVLTSRDMTGLYHHRSLRLHVEHDRPVQRVYARQACSCVRAAAYSWYTCPCSCSCHLSWCSGQCSCSILLVDMHRGKCKGVCSIAPIRWAIRELQRPRTGAGPTQVY